MSDPELARSTADAGERALFVEAVRNMALMGLLSADDEVKFADILKPDIPPGPAHLFSRWLEEHDGT